MRLFISWSGDRSKRVAELLNDWLQCVIQTVEPWVSTKDIDKGSLWFNEISDKLANTSIGIVCLTKENFNNPWILFEAGALSKGLSSKRVCTFLIDLKPEDLQSPLSQFNHTFPEKESVFNLVRTINISLENNALKESILGTVFETYWPQFKSKFQLIIDETKEVPLPKKDDNEMLKEILLSVRNLDRRIREVENVNQDKLSMGPREAKLFIKDLHMQGLNESEIIERSRIFLVPKGFVMRELDRLRNNENE